VIIEILPGTEVRVRTSLDAIPLLCFRSPTVTAVHYRMLPTSLIRIIIDYCDPASSESSQWFQPMRLWQPDVSDGYGVIAGRVEDMEESLQLDFETD
jgi:hypothetical protein